MFTLLYSYSRTCTGSGFIHLIHTEELIVTTLPPSSLSLSLSLSHSYSLPPFPPSSLLLSLISPFLSFTCTLLDLSMFTYLDSSPWLHYIWLHYPHQREYSYLCVTHSPHRQLCCRYICNLFAIWTLSL